MSYTNEETLFLINKKTDEKYEKLKEVISNGVSPAHNDATKEKDSENEKDKTDSETPLKEETSLKREIPISDKVLPPKNFKTTNKGAYEIELEWENPDQEKKNLLYFVFRQEVGDAELKWNLCYNGTETKIKCGGLKESTKYWFVVYSFYNGELSKECKFLLDETNKAAWKKVLKVAGAVTAGAAVVATGGVASVIAGGIAVAAGVEAATGGVIIIAGVLASGVAGSAVGFTIGTESEKKITEVLTPENLDRLKGELTSTIKLWLFGETPES